METTHKRWSFVQWNIMDITYKFYLGDSAKFYGNFGTNSEPLRV
jgi:hypothetical protein